MESKSSAVIDKVCAELHCSPNDILKYGEGVLDFCTAGDIITCTISQCTQSTELHRQFFINQAYAIVSNYLQAAAPDISTNTIEALKRRFQEIQVPQLIDFQ